MAKQTVTLHMYEKTDRWSEGQRVVDEFDYRPHPDLMNDRVWIGQCEVEIDWPEIDTRQMQIDALEEQIIKERGESQARINLLLDRISKLQAITHEVDE